MFVCKDGVCTKTQLNTCCFHCPEKDHCDDCCGTCAAGCTLMDELSEENALLSFNSTNQKLIQSIADLTAQKKALEDQEKQMKDRLRRAMEVYGIKSADTPLLKLTYVAASEATSIDSAKLKKRYPEIADECAKVTPRSAYVKIELKGGEK